jgi:hypothetical protein
MKSYWEGSAQDSTRRLSHLLALLAFVDAAVAKAPTCRFPERRGVYARGRSGGTFLLADPPERTPQNREKFVAALGLQLQHSYRSTIVHKGQSCELCIMQFTLP